jgi:tetratricopeptide (TPR) repeat protein
MNLAQVLDYLGRWEEALEHSRNGAAGLEKLVHDFPAVVRYRRAFGLTLMDLGSRCEYLGLTVEAATQHRKAISVQERLATDFPNQSEYDCLVGGSLDNLAGPIWRKGETNEARRLFDEAIRRGKKALERDPDGEMAQRFQAEHHAKLGILLTELGRRADSEPHQYEALAFRQKLRAQFPTDPEYPQLLALSQNTRGLWLTDIGRWQEAGAEHQKALEIRREAVRQSPKRSDLQIDLHVTHISVGHLARDRGQPKQALDWYAKAIDALEPILKKERRYVPAREALRDARRGRALALDRLRRHDDAVRDWVQAASLDDGRQRAVLRLGHSISRAHVTGKHQEALTDAETLAKSANGPTLAGMARLCALASALSSGAQNSAAPASFQEDYATRAVVLLGQAASKGYRDSLYLKEGVDLSPLRNRQDFQMLLKDAETIPERHDP